MNNLNILRKAFMISIKIKGKASITVGILGFAAAFLPVLVAGRLSALTDALLSLSAGVGEARAALLIFAGLAGLYIVQTVFSHIQQYMNGWDGLKIRRYIKHTIMRHKCEVRYKYIENYDDFQKRVAFTEEFAGYRMAECITGMLTIIQQIVAFTAAALALWPVSPWIVVILFATSVPAALLSYAQQDETFRSRAKWMEEGALAIHYFHMISGGGEGLESLQEIRHFALFDYLKARWRAIADEYIGKKDKLMAKHVKYNTAADFLRSAVFLVILLAAARSIYLNPMLGLGAFTLVFALSGQLQSVTGECMVNIMTLAQNIPYIREFLHLDELEREPASVDSEPAANGEVQFEQVTFAYPNTEKAVIENLSVRIKEGEKIAIVGENGSGKSTFISLLCGMFEPQTGHIRVGGADAVQSPQRARGAVSVVFQDFARYETTLRENITLSDRNRRAQDDEIMALLKRIHVNEVVDIQPHGLDEQLGSFSEQSNNLSGGEWQKISIARAAYRNAKIMILDEPTAALDPMAEAQLYRNFAALTGDKTTILISHRLGITAVVDRILVFKDGQIVEDGSHRQLMALNGHYADMYRAQAKWYV